MRYFVLLLSVIFSVTSTHAESTSDSLFNVPFNWIAENGKSFSLQQLKGKPTVVSMIYTQCKSACPLTIQRVQAIEDKLGDQSKQVNFLLVTLDPGRDKAKELLHFKESHKIDRPNWHLLTGSEADVRKFSVLIGYSFQKDTSTQEILHSNKLLMLLPDGSIGFTLEGLASDTDTLVDAITNNLVAKETS